MNPTKGLNSDMFANLMATASDHASGENVSLLQTLKNTNGTNIMNNKFKNKSPTGLNITASGPINTPTIPPNIIAPNNIKDDL